MDSSQLLNPFDYLPSIRSRTVNSLLLILMHDRCVIIVLQSDSNIDEGEHMGTVEWTHWICYRGSLVLPSDVRSVGSTGLDG